MNWDGSNNSSSCNSSSSRTSDLRGSNGAHTLGGDGSEKSIGLNSRVGPSKAASEHTNDTYPLKKKRKRAPVVQRSLAVVLCSMQGNQVVVECKNGYEISGIILEVSEAGLGMLLGAARVVDTTGGVTEHVEYYVNGSGIRYVHLPPAINAARHLNKYIFEKESALELSNRPPVIVDKEKLRSPRPAAS
jgi:small nuclear ribonucleoprotein (snRNP)-like protein